MIIDILLLILLVLAVYKGWTRALSWPFLYSSLISQHWPLHFIFQAQSKDISGHIRTVIANGIRFWLSFWSWLQASCREAGWKAHRKSAELMLLGLVNRFLGILVMAIIYVTFSR